MDGAVPYKDEIEDIRISKGNSGAIFEFTLVQISFLS